MNKNKPKSRWFLIDGSGKKDFRFTSTLKEAKEKCLKCTKDGTQLWKEYVTKTHQCERLLISSGKGVWRLGIIERYPLELC